MLSGRYRPPGSEMARYRVLVEKAAGAAFFYVLICSGDFFVS